MDERTFETLELKDLIALAARHVQTAPGRIKMLNLRPSTSRAEILRELEITSECVTFLNTRGRFGLSGIEDLDPVIAQLHIEGTSLEPKQILAIERLLWVAKEVKVLIRSEESTGHFPHLLRWDNFSHYPAVWSAAISRRCRADIDHVDRESLG